MNKPTAGPGILAECDEIAYGMFHFQHCGGLAHHHRDAIRLGALLRWHAARENGESFPAKAASKLENKTNFLENINI